MSFSVRTFILNLINSLGLKRKLSNVFQALAVVVLFFPAVQGFGTILQSIASWLGLIGICHAAAAKTLSLDIHSVAALLSALLLAVKDMPQLQPYGHIIELMARLIGSLATASLVLTKLPKAE